MATDDAPDRLTAGLDRDEELARSATARHSQGRLGGLVRRVGRHRILGAWVADDGDVYAVFGSLTDPSRCDQHQPGRPNECDDAQVAVATGDLDETEVAEHIAHFDPARVLRQVEAFRKVLEEHRPDRRWPRDCGVCRQYDELGNWDSVQWPCPTIRALAGIYGEESL